MKINRFKELVILFLSLASLASQAGPISARTFLLEHDGIRRSVVLIGEFHDDQIPGKSISPKEQMLLDGLKAKRQAHPFRLLWETTPWNMQHLIKEKGYQFIASEDPKSVPFLFLLHAQERLKDMGILPEFAKFLPASHTLEAGIIFAQGQINDSDQRSGAEQIRLLLRIMDKIPKGHIKAEFKDMALRVALLINSKNAQRYTPGLKSSYSLIKDRWSDFDKKYFGKASTIGGALRNAIEQSQINMMKEEFQLINSLLRDIETLLVILEAKDDLVVYGGFDHMVHLAALLEMGDATFSEKSFYEQQMEGQAAKLRLDLVTQKQFANVVEQLGLSITIVKPQCPSLIAEWIACWSHVLAHQCRMPGLATELRSHYTISVADWSLALKSGAELYQYRQGILNNSYSEGQLPTSAQTLVNEYLGLESN